MHKDYSNFKNIYYISYNNNEYEVTGNSKDSALRCLSKYLNDPVISYNLLNKIEVVGSANSPKKSVYKVNGKVICDLDCVEYL